MTKILKQEVNSCNECYCCHDWGWDGGTDWVCVHEKLGDTLMELNFIDRRNDTHPNCPLGDITDKHNL